MLTGAAPPASAVAEYEGFEALLPLVDKERLGAAAMGWDHRRMRRLLGRLGDPQLGLRCTLVAGSKGKGSTALLLAHALAAAGRRPGLYTQPHLSRYAERIRWGPSLAELSPEAARDLLRRVLAAAAGPVTAFEAATATALLAFAEAGVSDAVLEAGFGGRLDATAEAEPALVLLTTLETEHPEVLGETLGAVAASELSLMTYGRLCRTAAQPDEVLRLWAARARSHGVDAAAVPRAVPLPDGRLRLLTPAGARVDVLLGLPGRYQWDNAALAAAGAEALGVPAAALAPAFAAARWPGRFEHVPGRPDILLDGAHTPGSAQALALALTHAHGARRTTFVVGMLRDKDAVGFARPLHGRAAGVWTVAPRHPRALPAAQLAAAWPSPASPAPSLSAALRDAALAAGGEGLCVITGSLHLVAEARELLGLAAPRP
jgi:dihydrofolate synthase/folylpolyglutamate synthase